MEHNDLQKYVKSNPMKIQVKNNIENPIRQVFSEINTENYLKNYGTIYYDMLECGIIGYNPSSAE